MASCFEAAERGAVCCTTVGDAMVIRSWGKSGVTLSRRPCFEERNVLCRRSVQMVACRWLRGNLAVAVLWLCCGCAVAMLWRV